VNMFSCERVYCLIPAVFCAQTRSFQLGVLIALLSLYDAYAAVHSTWIAKVSVMCLLVHLQQ